MNLLGRTSIELLGIYNVVQARTQPDARIPSIRTIVVRLVKDYDRKTVLRSLNTISWISKTGFTSLNRVIIVGRPIENFRIPLRITGPGGAAEEARKRWDEQGVQVCGPDPNFPVLPSACLHHPASRLASMPTIHSLPVETLRQIFDIITYDPGVLYPAPSWKDWDPSLLASGKVFDGTSSEATHHAIALSQVCNRWRYIAIPLKYRRVLIRWVYDLDKVLNRLRLHPGAEGSIKRLDLVYGPPRGHLRGWNDYFLEKLFSLIKLCSNLEVFWSEFDPHITAFQDPDYGDILQVVAASCKNLKWLHWKGHRSCLTDFKWTSTIATFSALEALEMQMSMDAKKDYDPIILSLPSLKYLRVVGSSWQLADVVQWELPSLTALHLSTSMFDSSSCVPDLVTKLDSSLKLLNLDSDATFISKLDMLAGTSVGELGFWNMTPWPEQPSAPLPLISTVVMRVFDPPGPHIETVRRTLTEISWVSRSTFAELQEVVVIGSAFEGIEKPHCVSALCQDHILELACRRWDEEGVK
ncbi:hypothetical protein FRB90_009273, partial [Tulasnella sp. 427]